MVDCDFFFIRNSKVPFRLTGAQLPCGSRGTVSATSELNRSLDASSIEMENMQYAEELLREYLVFRGFTNTLQAFETELSTDIGKAFQVDKIVDLIFSTYIPKFQIDKLVGLFSFFKQCFSSASELVFFNTLSRLEVSVLRCYIVYAVQSGRKEKVGEFLAMNGNDLLLRNEDWTPWFAVPYLKNPSNDPRFCVYFSKEWYDALRISLRNFFSEIFNGTPALMKISSEKNTVARLKKDIKQLNVRLSQLQALLEDKETQLSQLKSSSALTMDVKKGVNYTSNASQDLSEKTSDLSQTNDETRSTAPVDSQQNQEPDKRSSTAFTMSKTLQSTSSLSTLQTEHGRTPDSYQISDVGSFHGNVQETPEEADFVEVNIEFQETFLGHTSPITCCRFSASGDNIASASMDGTVRIWTYDSSTPASRNATIYCGSEIMSLDWECKSNRLLLIGTADGGVKAWNVDAKRVVCDLSTAEAFPSVLDLKCSPVEPIFVSAAASKRKGSLYIDKLGFASLTVWNMKTWKPVTVLPLGEDPPAITSICFNHNGKILAASATDGMIHMFDMSAGLQITGWPAHDSAISSILFGPDETSIYSLGSDGKIFEWSLQNHGQVIWSRSCKRFVDPESMTYGKHEMALDADGKRLLVSSDLVRAPIYQVQSHSSGLKTLAHCAAITTVDWHPTLPIFLTGSVDNSVRVTSIL